jgi:hypothetical protein
VKETHSKNPHTPADQDENLWVRFICPEGHRLKADPRLAGQTAACPKCGGQATIPAPISNLLTDTGALRLLETAPAPRSTEERKHTRYCPRCGASVPDSASLCGRCRLYQFPSEVWRSLARSSGE